jgi:hypothetical protein
VLVRARLPLPRRIARHAEPDVDRGSGCTGLIGDQVVQVGEPRQKRLLTAAWMVKRFHHEQLPVDGIMGLIQQGTRHGHLRIGEHCIPARLLLLHPAPGRVGRQRVVSSCWYFSVGPSPNPA